MLKVMHRALYDLHDIDSNIGQVLTKLMINYFSQMRQREEQRSRYHQMIWQDFFLVDFKVVVNKLMYQVILQVGLD